MFATASPASADRSERVLSVSQLTAQFKTVVEQQFPSVWVAGEISNFSRPQSGHCYFTLKDDKAQLRGVIWRGTASRLKFDLHDGLEVVCRGRLDVYPPRGSYQLVVDQLQPQGIGALELALRKLRAKLEAEGLFAPTRKRALPSFPRRIGIVTSPTGAAIHDFLQVLDRRWQGVEVLILPVRVQGTEATGEIATAIEQAGRIVPPLDVLVVGRGGGSLEDLWAFNEELVVRAIASSVIPVISAVGHEIDVTLADLAADVRALTPSEAAERVVPSAEDVTQLVKNLQLRLQGSLIARTANLRSRLDALASRPAMSRPLERVHLLGRRADELAMRLNTAMRTRLGKSQAEIETFAGKLEALSPLAVLQRGYSLTQDQTSGVVIRTAQQLQTGQRLRTRLAQGEVVSVVE
ncbi:MAG: exodeoxyribonuclease VII large subunit [Pirellulales bacterium]